MPPDNKLSSNQNSPKAESPKATSPKSPKAVSPQITAEKVSVKPPTDEQLNTAEEHNHRSHRKKEGGVRSLPPLLKTDELIRERYKVDRMIGGGGFGQIFLAHDTVKNNPVAIKIEPQYTDARRMKLEQIVLVALRGKAHVPTIMSSGKSPSGSPFIVMQLLGRNLSEMRRREKSRKLSQSTVYRSAQQILSGLRSMHEVNYLHRDVKPSNCCVSRINPRVIYIVDFGMARLFVDGNGNLRPARQSVGFRGTVRYVSLNVHAKKESGPGDDLIGLMYSTIELTEGSLPWTQIKDILKVEEAKQNIGEKLYENQPDAFAEYYKNVNSLVYDQIPDYEFLINTLKKCLSADFDASTLYDWEVERPTKNLYLDLVAPNNTPANQSNHANQASKPVQQNQEIEKPKRSTRKKPPSVKTKQNNALLETTQHTCD